MSYIDWVGAVGVFQILLAYILNISGKLDKNRLVFILLNLIGAIMACWASLLMKYMPFIILEGFWTLASLISLINYIRKKGKWQVKRI